MRNLWKSVLAVFVGFLVAAVASALADFTMGSIGLMEFENFKNSPTWVEAIVVVYRFLFNTIGSYTTAKLAPTRPMRLVMIGGTIGFVLSIIGAASMWEKAAPWYSIAIIVIALPAAYIGGTLHAKANRNVESVN